MTDQQPRKVFTSLTRIILVGLMSAVVVSFCTAGVYFGVERNRISKVNSAFSRIAPGDAEATVVELMGPPLLTLVTEQYFYPNAQNFEGENGPGARQLCYHVDTYFLPITWVITIDSEGLVKNKFRLD